MRLFPRDRNLSVSPDRVELEVRASDFGVEVRALEIRLDAFLARHLTWRSRTSIQRLVRDGYVDVAHLAPERDAPGEPACERRAGRLLKHGARVVVRIPPEHRLPAVLADAGELDVLYEDEAAVAIDKPAGMPVHPSGRHVANTLIQRVHALYQGDEDTTLDLPLRLCHRLDRETSGIVLVGKGEVAHRELQQQFETRRVEKEYLAVVHGEPSADSGVVELALGPALASEIRLRMAVQADGLPSVTEWRVLDRRRGFALVACRPRTGRQHQIRVHMEALGHPLVGDKLYGKEDGVFLRSRADELTDADRRALVLPRHALHNHRLAWTSPLDGERREVVSPLASDLKRFFEDGVVPAH